MEQQAGSVTFNNGRIGQWGTVPQYIFTYKDQWGNVHRFKDIPLMKPDGVTPDMRINKEGKEVPVTYGKHLAYGRQRGITLDKNVFKNVIQVIRDLDITVSHSKSDWAPAVFVGKILEYEPQYEEMTAFEAVNTKRKVNRRLEQVMEAQGTDIFWYIMVLLGIPIDLSEKALVTRLYAEAEDRSDEFLSLFDQEDPEMKLGSHLINEAIVRLAVARKVIVNRNGVYFLGEMNLGPDITKIWTDHFEQVGQIKAEMDRGLGKSKARTKAIEVEAKIQESELSLKAEAPAPTRRKPGPKPGSTRRKPGPKPSA